MAKESLPLWVMAVGNFICVAWPIAYLLVPAVRARADAKLFPPRSRSHINGRAESRTLPAVLCGCFFLMAVPDWDALVDPRSTASNLGTIASLVCLALSLVGWFTTYWFAWPKWLVTKPFREDLSLMADWRSVRRSKRQRRKHEPR